MVAMASMAQWLSKLPMFNGSYSNMKAPEGLCSAYIFYLADHLQKKKYCSLTEDRKCLQDEALLAPSCNHSNQ
jgi:hypothetical protein